MARDMINALMKKFISQPKRMGAPTQSRNILGINHPLAESSPVARIPISMMPGGGPVSGYTQEDLATLKLPEETTLFSPLGYDITDKDLAKVGLATDAMDLLPGAAIVGGMATGAGLLGRALKGKDYAPTSTEDIASALLAPSLQRQGALDDAMVTYQGSPHKFDALDPSKIGTGENAQAFGHGMYVAENPGVAKGYQRSTPFAEMRRKFLEEIPEDAEFDELMDLVAEGHFSPEQERVIKALEADDWLGFDYPSQAISEAYGPYLKNFDPSPELVESVKGLSGHLYEIDVPDEDITKMLDWDKPLSEQPESVKQVILDSPVSKQFEKQMNDAREAFGVDAAPDWMDDYTGQSYYKELVELEGNKLRGVLQPGTTRHTVVSAAELASKHLEELGIPGIKYFDQGSRAAGEGTRNMVLFDDLARRAKVLKRNDETIADPSVDEFIGDLARTPQELTIRDEVPNLGSIRSSLTNWEEVPGIQQIPMSEFNAAPRDLFYAADDLAHVDSLANEIRQSGEISPLIVVQDSEGYYVLEGAHRLGALHEMGQPSVPALVIKDLDNPVEPSVDEFIGKLLED